MRPAGPDDLIAMQEIANRALRAARLPTDMRVRPLLAPAWAVDSRIVPDVGWVAIHLARTVDDGDRVITNLFSLEDSIRRELLEWAIARARQLRAAGIGLWLHTGKGEWLVGYGFRPVRPFWRMDRADLDDLPVPVIPAGYRLVDGRSPDRPLESWIDALNGAFADHWRHAPEDAAHPRQELLDADRGLHLMLLSPTGRPAAVVIASVFETDDARGQPVGYLHQVGTLPEHRRRGLARALTTIALRRLRDAGAASASLNVDAQNASRAFDLYGSLAFSVAREYEVWSLELSNPIDRGPGTPSRDST